MMMFGKLRVTAVNTALCRRNQLCFISKLNDPNRIHASLSSAATANNTKNNIRPIGVLGSFRALPPAERLVVILCFSTVGFVGLYTIDRLVNPDNHRHEDGINTRDETVLYSVRNFFRWCVAMARHDLNEDLERWRKESPSLRPESGVEKEELNQR